MSEQAEKGTSNNSSSAQKSVLTGNKSGVIGIKAGMTQVFNPDGDIIPVTVIDLQPLIITQVKTKDKEGYESVQVGILPKKNQRVTKAEKGHFKKSGFPGFYRVSEFPVASIANINVGSEVSSTEMFKEGDLVDVTSTSKGKGFQGGMKRYNMAGGFKTHGASVSHRSLGSIGNRADPAKCFKNKKMPGQMGNKQVTVQNLTVISVDSENNLMLVRGSVPGHKKCFVTVRKSIKHIG